MDRLTLAFMIKLAAVLLIGMGITYLMHRRDARRKKNDENPHD